MYETIIVPTDGSENARAAVSRALDIAAEHDAVVHCLCVIDTSRYEEPALSTVELVTDQAEDVAHGILEVVEREAIERDVDVMLVCRHGVPAETVLDYANDVEADLIVMGYQGESHRHHIGSVTRKVLDTASIPVETV